MISLFAWNTRGFNKKRKHHSFSSWVRSVTPSFGCLIETRVQESNCHSIITATLPGWQYIHNYDHHRLRKIWVVWSDNVNVTLLCKSSQIITVWVTSSTGEQFLCSCIYASNYQNERRHLWSDLINTGSQYASHGVPWIIMGDFNETLSSSEHYTGLDPRHQSGMQEFQAAVSTCNLTDLASLGAEFTWTNSQPDNLIAKKLDRVLVNDVWISQYSQSYAQFEPSGVSDHTRCRVLLETPNLGKKRPFKFFNFLADHPDFTTIVTESWNSAEPLYHSRSALYLFHRKLKQLKPAIRLLNKTRFSNIPLRAKEAFQNLCDKQEQALSTPNTASFNSVAEAMDTWNYWVSIEERFYMQKSRITWLKYGDQNTVFFHKIVQTRTSFNAIRKLVLQNGAIITDPTEIKQAAANYFAHFLGPSESPIPNESIIDLSDLLEFRCPDHTAALLVHPISEAEIRNVLFSMPSNKAPGPDGYPVEFYRAAWPIINRDFTIAVQSFFIYGFLPKGVNATTLALIPKVLGAETLKDFRPISCCNILYKVISKVLANRLKVLLPELIEPNQCAFVKGRLLLENVLLATELVKNYHKDSIGPRSVLKLDISKAFDSVKWSFILDTLRAMNIPDQFVHWIHTCLSTAAFSVSVNGELEGFFPSTRGLRQGCALSPYLFFIAINVLSRLLNKAALAGKIGFHPTCSDVNLTYLSFVDDIMVFTNGDPASLRGIFAMLDEFAVISGLVINPAKSSIFMAGRISQAFKEEVNRLGIPVDTLPVRYLGLPLTTKSMSRADYEPLIDKIRSRFLSWSSRALSYAGRLQLINSVIVSITNFWCSVFRLPKSCLETIESMCSAFLWSGSPHSNIKAKVAWHDICKPKQEGGLGIRRIADSSRVFALSLIWRLLTNSGSLWVAWTKQNLLRRRCFWDISDTGAGSWIWRKLLKLRQQAASYLRSAIGNGRNTLFWFDN